MKTLKFANKEDWLQARVGKIMGTKLKDVIRLRGNGYKKGFWELIAERVALAPDGENPLERGQRLEEEALARFAKETGKKVDTSLVMWISDKDENVAISPDGFILEKKKVTEAVETKCLNSASHIEAFITKEVPSDYHFQKLQYFIVNPDLKRLYFAFYDPRIEKKDFFYLTVNREDVQEEVEEYLKQELEIIKEVERITLELVGF